MASLYCYRYTFRELARGRVGHVAQVGRVWTAGQTSLYRARLAAMARAKYQGSYTWDECPEVPDEDGPYASYLLRYPGRAFFLEIERADEFDDGRNCSPESDRMLRVCPLVFDMATERWRPDEARATIYRGFDSVDEYRAAVMAEDVRVLRSPHADAFAREWEPAVDRSPRDVVIGWSVPLPSGRGFSLELVSILEDV